MELPFAREEELGVITLPAPEAPTSEQLVALERAVAVGPVGWTAKLAAGRSQDEINEGQRAFNSSVLFTLVETRREVVRTLVQRVTADPAAEPVLTRIARERAEDTLGFVVGEVVLAAGAPRGTLEAVAAWIDTPSPYAHWHWQLGARAVLATTSPEQAFERLAPSLADLDHADRVLAALAMYEGALDPRWFGAAARFLCPESAAPNSGNVFWRHAADPRAVEVVSREAQRVAETGNFNGYFYNTLGNMKAPGTLPGLVAIVKAASAYSDWRLTRPLGILAEIGDRAALDELRALVPSIKGRAKTAVSTVIRDLEAKLGVAPVGKPKAAPKPKSPLAEQLVAAGLSAQRANSIDKLARVRIDLAPSPVDEGVAPRLGATRFGGAPDLPAGTPWPHVTCTDKQLTLAPSEYISGTLPAPDAKGRYEVPLEFVAQLDLAELAAHDVEGLLPTSGTLWFFARQEVVMGEKRDLQQIAAAVLHAPTGTTLATAEIPSTLPGHARHPPARIAITHCRPLPPPTIEPFDNLGLVAAEQTAYERAREHNPPSADHATLGWAEDAAYFRGIPAPKEQLLLRCGSDAISEFEWGDAASIFFVIPSAALAKQDFAKAYCLMDE